MSYKQFAYENNVNVDINDIIDFNKIYYNIAGEELEICDGKHIKKYFRRKTKNKNIINNLMSDWHKNWQNEFNCEKEYCHNNMIKKKRICDVELDNNFIIEFQNSLISEKEVNDRKKDYKLVNKKNNMGN